MLFTTNLRLDVDPGFFINLFKSLLEIIFLYFLSRTSNNQILNALLDLKSDVTLTLGYCNPALNHQVLYVTQCLSTY